MASPSLPESDPDNVGSVAARPPLPQGPSSRQVPDAVAWRYLRIDDRYFFADRTLAFRDTATRIEVRTQAAAVIDDIVAIVQARGWQAIGVTGTAAFRQRIWHAATLQGISVQGYNPSARDMRQLQRALDDRAAAPDAAPRFRTAPVSDSPASDTAPATRVPSSRWRMPWTGRLLTHAAPSRPANPAWHLSYRMQVQTGLDDERTSGDTGLRQAVSEPRSGRPESHRADRQPRSLEPALLMKPTPRNDDSAADGPARMAGRLRPNTETASQAAALERKAAVFNDEAMTAHAILTAHPDLAVALAGMQLAVQYVQRLSADPEVQVRMVRAIRHGLAQAIARGQEVHLPAPRSPQPHVPQRSRGSRHRDDPDRVRA